MKDETTHKLNLQDMHAILHTSVTSGLDYDSATSWGNS